MSIISTIMGLLTSLPEGTLRIVSELVKTIVDAPEGEREATAMRALKAAASKRAMEAGVDAALGRMKP